MRHPLTEKLYFYAHAASNPFTKRDWSSLLRDDPEYSSTFDSEDVKTIKARCGMASTHQELSVKASNLVSSIVHSQNKKVILIGESSHGTAEFYETRAHITRQLIEDKVQKMPLLKLQTEYI